MLGTHSDIHAEKDGAASAKKTKQRLQATHLRGAKPCNSSERSGLSFNNSGTLFSGFCTRVSYVLLQFTSAVGDLPTELGPDPAAKQFCSTVI